MHTTPRFKNLLYVKLLKKHCEEPYLSKQDDFSMSTRKPTTEACLMVLAHQREYG